MNKPQSTENIDLFDFGEFSLDAARRELRKKGEPVEIEPRAFDLLLYLARNRDRAVDKDELQDAVWPSMIVTETALTRAVMKARKAVGDDASTQGVIKTLHGHGYRFVAPVIVAEISSPQSSGDSASAGQTASDTTTDTGLNSVEGKSPFSSSRTRMSVVVLLILVAVIAWVVLRQPNLNTGDLHIAVLPVNDTTDNPELAWSRLGLMSFVSQLIGADGQLTVVPEASVVSLSDNFEWNGDSTSPTSLELFERLRSNFGASHILFMELKSEGPSLRMNYHLLGPDDRSRSGTIVGDKPTELAQGVVQGVYGLTLRKSHIGTEYPLVSDDPFNNEAFARGMSLSLAGRCAEAQQFFRVIVEQEPELFAPRYEYAYCLRILGENEEAEAILNQLIEDQVVDGSPRSLAQARLVLGILYYRTGRPDQAMVEYNQALDLTDQIDDPDLKARVLQNLSIANRGFSNLDEAKKQLDLATLAYQDAGREKLPGHLYGARANLAMARGDFTQAENYLEQALQAFRDVGDRRNEAMMMNNTGYVKWQQGRLNEAETYIRQSLAIRQEIGDRVGVGRNYTMLSGLHSANGDYEQAIEAASAALGIAQESNDRLFEATSLAQLAEAETALGDLPAARQHYLEARAIFEAIKDYLRILQVDLKIAGLDLLGNQVDEARTLATQVLEQAQEQNIMEPRLEAQVLLGDIEVARGDSPSAIHIYSEVLEQVRETSWTGLETSLESKLANTYMDLGDLDSAAPIAGALAEKEPDLNILLTRARFDFLRSNQVGAVDLMGQAKNFAGPNWSDENEALLQKYLSETPP